MSLLYAEFFTRLWAHPVVSMMLALFSSTVAFRPLCRMSFSVQLLRVAFLFEVFSVYGLTVHLHVIARNVLLSWSAVFFFVFDACAIAWVRDRQDVRADLVPDCVQSCDADSTRLRATSP
jgi:hypothetical protein